MRDRQDKQKNNQSSIYSRINMSINLNAQNRTIQNLTPEGNLTISKRKTSRLKDRTNTKWTITQINKTLENILKFKDNPKIT